MTAGIAPEVSTSPVLATGRRPTRRTLPPITISFAMPATHWVRFWTAPFTTVALRAITAAIVLSDAPVVDECAREVLAPDHHNTSPRPRRLRDDVTPAVQLLLPGHVAAVLLFYAVGFQRICGEVLPGCSTGSPIAATNFFWWAPEVQRPRA